MSFDLAILPRTGCVTDHLKDVVLFQRAFKLIFELGTTITDDNFRTAKWLDPCLQKGLSHQLRRWCACFAATQPSHLLVVRAMAYHVHEGVSSSPPSHIEGIDANMSVESESPWHGCFLPFHWLALSRALGAAVIVLDILHHTVFGPRSFEQREHLVTTDVTKIHVNLVDFSYLLTG